MYLGNFWSPNLNLKKKEKKKMGKERKEKKIGHSGH